MGQVALYAHAWDEEAGIADHDEDVDVGIDGQVPSLQGLHEHLVAPPFPEMLIEVQVGKRSSVSASHDGSKRLLLIFLLK